MAVYSFLDEYDLSGKTDIPFVTSGGSGFSDALSIIQEMESGADVITDGFKTIHSCGQSGQGDEPRDTIADLPVDQEEEMRHSLIIRPECGIIWTKG